MTLIKLENTISKLSGKKILITGAGGMLGTAFKETLENYVPDCKILALTKENLDVTDREQVLTYVNEKPNYILHCAGKVNADYCEEHQNESYEIIVKGTSNVIELAKLTRSKLLYPQSFLIYDGNILPINEDTKPKPLSVYGKHKLEAELYALKDLSEVLVVRMAGFFGGREKDKNFVGKIVSQIAKLVQDGESSIEIGNRIWQPTYTNDLALNCLLLLSEEKNGKYNMASHGQASFYELAKEIVSLLGVKNKIKIIPVDSSKFSKKEKAKRPLLALIENKRLKKEGLDCQRRWEDSLKEYLSHQFFKNLF